MRSPSRTSSPAARRFWSASAAFLSSSPRRGLVYDLEDPSDLGVRAPDSVPVYRRVVERWAVESRPYVLGERELPGLHERHARDRQARCVLRHEAYRRGMVYELFEELHTLFLFSIREIQILLYHKKMPLRSGRAQGRELEELLGHRRVGEALLPFGLENLVGRFFADHVVSPSVLSISDERELFFRPNASHNIPDPNAVGFP